MQQRCGVCGSVFETDEGGGGRLDHAICPACFDDANSKVFSAMAEPVLLAWVLFRAMDNWIVGETSPADIALVIKEFFEADEDDVVRSLRESYPKGI